MKCSEKFSFPLALGLVFTAIMANPVQASTESVSIKPSDDFVRTLQLVSGDQVTLTYKVLGPYPNALRLSVLLPNGTNVDYGSENQGIIRFSTDVDGKCMLLFENNDPSNIQLLTLDYNVEHYIFGLPTLLFVLIAVAVLLVFVIAGYMAMGKYAA